MATLYEIDQSILACVDGETGEILDGERLAELQIEREQKIESVALWYKNLLSDAEVYKAEKNSFAEKEKRAKERAESLKAWLDNALSGEPFKAASGRVAISYRKSETVVVDDLFSVPDEYLRYKEPELDKMSVKKAIKEGMQITGVHIEEKNNISIK